MASLDDIKRLQEQFTSLFKDATDARSRVSHLENILWETRGKQEGTERKLADTENKLADVSKKLKDTQKKQAVSERKLGDYEKELADMRERLLENESKMEDWKAKQEKKCKKIGDKLTLQVQLNSKEIGQLKMLQSMFKAGLIGKAHRFLNHDEIQNKLIQVDGDLTVVMKTSDDHSEQMENMEAIVKEIDTNLTVVHKNGDELSKKIKTLDGKQMKLNADVTGLCKSRDQHSQEIKTLDGKQMKLNADVSGLQKTVDHHSTKLKCIPSYYSTLSRQCKMDHSKGVLAFQNDPKDSSEWSAFMALQPLKDACLSFSLEILSTGSPRWGCEMGLVPNDWDGKRGIGKVRGTVCYNVLGNIWDSGKEVHDSGDGVHKVGDIIQAQLTISPAAVTFSRNGKTVFCHPLDPGVFSTNNLYPAIHLMGEGTAVRLLEADPWRA